MHDDEIEIDEDLVRQLVVSALPDHAHLPLSRVEAWGTDHVIYRLGDECSVRLPKIWWAATQGRREERWLPVLAAGLAVEVPVPIFLGEPTEHYPYHWYVSPWLHGTGPGPSSGVDLDRLAVDLAAVLLDLQRVDTTGAPTPRAGQRGGPLEAADTFVRVRADELRAHPGVDVDGLLAVWKAGLAAPAWEGEAVWVHGDLSDGNLLVRDGRLSGLIDWGAACAADPAVELMVAWNLFDADQRATFREALGFVDDAMWLRGRAWATEAALTALPYYRDTNPDIVARSWHTVHEVLADDAGL